MDALSSTALWRRRKLLTYAGELSVKKLSAEDEAVKGRRRKGWSKKETPRRNIQRLNEAAEENEKSAALILEGKRRYRWPAKNWNPSGEASLWKTSEVKHHYFIFNRSCVQAERREGRENEEKQKQQKAAENKRASETEKKKRMKKRRERENCNQAAYERMAKIAKIHRRSLSIFEERNSG